MSFPPAPNVNGTPQIQHSHGELYFVVDGSSSPVAEGIDCSAGFNCKYYTPLRATVNVIDSLTQEQAETLGALRHSLEANPVAIPLLCKTLLPTVPANNDTLFKRWVLDLVHFGVSRSALPMEERTKCQLFFVALTLFFPSQLYAYFA